MKKVHQLVHTLSYGDAISGEVIALQRVFREAGVESEIYCINVHPKYKGMALDYRDFQEREGADFDGTILLHYSLGSPLNDLFRRYSSATRSMIYHNLTPSHWFENVNPRIIRDLEQGKKELVELCGICDFIIADSKYNASEIKAIGFDAAVLELPIDPKRWDMSSNPGISQMLQSDGNKHILHVGRLAPNKCIEDIIRIFYFMHHHGDKNTRLWLPGIDIDTEIYSFSLQRLVQELALEHAVTFMGCVDDSELRSLYEHSDLYLCMSEHEGFCLPVVEAMHFGCPVLAYASTALPDTIGSGGVLVSEKKHAEIAEVALEIIRNDELRSTIIGSGKARVAGLNFTRFSKEVHELFNVQASSSESQHSNKRLTA